MSASPARRLKARVTPHSLQLALPWRLIMTRLLLALMLLVAQQGTLLHALGHGFEELKQGSPQSQTHHHECCAAFHGMDHAAAGAPSLPVADQAVIAEIAQTAHAVLPAFHANFRSRAPPRFS